MHSRLLSAALVGFCLCGAARIGEAADGIQIVQRTMVNGKPMTTQMQIENTRLRTELADQQGTAQVVIFDGQKEVIYIVDNARKSYMEMSKADLERLLSQVQGMMAQMQAQLDKLPPAQRAQMEAVMKGRMGGMGAAPKMEAKRVGTDKVGRWTCDKYEVLANGQKQSDVCTVDPSQLGAGVADYKVWRQLADFASQVPQMAGQVSIVGYPDKQGYTGFPVRTISYVGGQTVTSEVTEASRQTFADALFTVPAGYTKQPMPGIAPGR